MVSGTVTRVIDGNTIVIDGIKIRSPFIDVVDSGNSTTTHAKLARRYVLWVPRRIIT